ncbi:MAG: DUF1576 domain-containing protein [Oscillospiraceae bacterium]|nr:DUF1576 domain-containing protein [Oscillospiraceae bacterium]
MSETIEKKWLRPYTVWGLLMLLTIAYGFVFATPREIVQGLWRIYTSPALLTHDYIHHEIGGLGAALVNSGMSGLFVLGAFKLAKLPQTGLPMGAFGLVMGFALLGKNPLNMFPIVLGAFLYSRYKKRPWKETVTISAFATCLAPVVSQPAHIEQLGVPLGILIGFLLGVIIGFVINSMGGFIKKSHEGLNLYNIGWGAGLLSIALAVIYNAIGVERFAVGTFVSGGNNLPLNIYLAGIAVFFFVAGILAKPTTGNLLKIANMKADDNDFYVKYGAGDTYIGMGMLAVLALLIMNIVRVEFNGPVLGAIVSMIGWGGYGKSVANSAAIIAGVMLGGLARTLLVADFAFNAAVIYTSAFWGTCLSPMAKFFGLKWALVIGFVHFAFAFSIAPFHWGMNLYNNGLAAGFVCVVMIPVIRAFDRKGKYDPKVV